MAFVGEERAKLVDDLAGWFAEVSGSGRSMFVSIEGPTGWGKTRILQEVYARLADGQSYWPSTLLPSESEDPLQNRKWLYPKAVEPPEGVELPWMWWGIPCARTDTGRPRQVITDEVTQLVAHHKTLIRRSETKDLAKSALVSVASFATSILVPSVSDLIGIAQTSKELIDVAAHGSRRLGVGAIDADDAERADVVEDTAQLIRLISNANIPVFLVIEDAHDADPSLLRLLDRALLNPGKGGLFVVALGWGDEIARQTRDDDDTDFGSWLVDFEKRAPELATRVPLERLAAAELAELVREVAPRTRPEVVAALAERADGNPLVLTSLLEVDQVKFSIDDAAIGLTVAEVRELPHEYRSILQRRWESLDREVQLALCLAATQGVDFVRELVVSSYDSLGRNFPGEEAISQACDTIGWVRDMDKHLRFFEIYHYELAREGIVNFLGRSKLDSMRRDLVDQIQRWESDQERWGQIPEPTRQLLQMTQIRALSQTEANFSDLGRLAAGVSAGRELAYAIQGMGRAAEILDVYEPIIKSARELGVLTPDEDARAWIVTRILRREAGDLRGSLKAARYAVEIRVGELGRSDRGALEAEVDLAKAERAVGRSRIALDSLLEISKRPEVAGSEVGGWVNYELAAAQWRMGFSREALATLDGLIGSDLEISEHDRSLYLNLRGLALMDVGRRSEALRDQEASYEMLAKLRGSDHLEALQARMGLGCALHELGRLDEAIEIFSCLEAAFSSRMGPAHPLRLNALVNLGSAMLDRGDVAVAADLLLEAYRREFIVFGPTHYFTIGALNRGLRALSVAGRESEFNDLRRSGISALTRLKDSLDPSAAGELYALSDTLSGLCSHSDALATHRLLVTLREQYLDATDERYLGTQINHAAFLKRAGKNAEAFDLESEWSPRCEEVLGEQHPLSIIAKRNLADSLRISGRAAEAAVLVEQILEVQRGLAGPDDAQVEVDERWLAELRETSAS